MEDEIDLREYVAVLLRHWKLIVGLTVVAALVAGLVSFIMPPTYEATAVISTSATGVAALARFPSTLIIFQGGISTSATGVVALATSDAVLEVAIATLGTLPPTLASPAALRPNLTASQPANTATVRLTVKDGDAARAAAIANAWADAIALSSEADSVPLQAELNAQISLLANLSASQYVLAWAIEDAASLRDRLAGRSPNSPAKVEDQALLISLSSQAVTAPNLPAQLQITGLTETTVGDQLEYLDDLAVSLEARRQILQRRAASLQNDIRGVQERLAKAQALITTPVPVQVIQRAQSADTRTSPKKAQNAVLAAALGLMAGIFAAFGWEWWKGGDKPTLPVTDKKDAQQSHE